MKPKILSCQNPPAVSPHLAALQSLYVAMPREPFKIMLRTIHQHQLLVIENERKTMRAREHERGREKRGREDDDCLYVRMSPAAQRLSNGNSTTSTFTTVTHTHFSQSLSPIPPSPFISGSPRSVAHQTVFRQHLD